MVQLFRLVVLAIVIWLVIRLIQSTYRRVAAGNNRRAPARPRGEPATMVRCAHCGVHLPRDDALAASGRFYCSRAHLTAVRNTGGDE